MNNELASLSKESIEIARYLVECAQDKKIQTYGKVHEEMKSRHKHTYFVVELSRYLDEINRVSHRYASVLLSVLVVNKDTEIPGGGFFDLAAELYDKPHLSKPDKGFFDKECERVYESARNKELNFFTDEK